MLPLSVKAPCLTPYRFRVAPPTSSINLSPFLLDLLSLHLPFPSQFSAPRLISIGDYVCAALYTAPCVNFPLLVRHIFSSPPLQTALRFASSLFSSCFF